jgi:plastocyanin
MSLRCSTRRSITDPEPSIIPNKENAMRCVVSRATTRLLQGSAALALAFCAAFAMPALDAAAASPAATIDVAITKFTFAPKDLTVAPGTRVVWTNRDETPHTVTSNDKSFASKGLDTDDKFEHTFGGEGDFSYICTVHPYMTGVVHVRK